MKDLVAASGLHRQTVHFYLRRGVLPPPVEAAGTRNARYGAHHLALLEVVHALQDQRGMSLDAIRRQFVQAQYDPEVARRAMGSGPSSTSLATRASVEPLGAGELVRRAGSSEAVLRSLEEIGLVTPEQIDGDARYGSDALTILSAAKRLADQGMSPESITRLARHVEGVASAEVAALAADASGLSGEGEPLASRAERRHQDIGELVSAVRRSALRGVLQRLVEVGPRAHQFAAEAIYIPSPLFIRRYRLDGALAEAEGAADRGDPEACLRLGRLLIGLGRYPEAAVWLSRCVQKQPRNDEAHGYLGLARSTGGEIASGVEACRQAVALAPESPRAHAFLGASLAIHAAMTTGLAHPGEQLRNALFVANHSRSLTPRDARERMEVLLARGRMFTVLPAGLPGHANGLADLEEVLALTTPGASDSGLDFPGTVALHRVHALYYLGVSAHQEDRMDDARRYLGECITIDPASRFAQQAYELLSTIE